MKTDEELFNGFVIKLHTLRRRMAETKIDVVKLPDDVEASRKKWVAAALSAGALLGLTRTEMYREILVGPFPRDWSNSKW